MTCYLRDGKCQMLTGEQQLDHPNAGEPVQVTSGSPLEHFYMVREPFVFKDPRNSPLLQPDVRLWVAAHGIRSILSVPLVFGDEPVGVLTIRDTQRDEFTPQEISLAQALGHHVTLAMELTRLAEHEKQSAVLHERNRMAQEIHDTLAQGLAGIVVQLEAAEDVLSGSPDDARAHIGRARTLARESLGEARRSVWALRPQALESGDLATALRHFAGQLTTGTPIIVEFSQRGTPCRLSPEAEFHLLRIGQEALTNAVKHAQAGKIRIELVHDAQGVQLSVQDDGRGFGPRQQSSNRGFGIISMNERAERVGAQLTIFSEPGLGTRVVAMFPTRADGSGGVPR
jgi:signal transduction histidine kinase